MVAQTKVTALGTEVKEEEATGLHVWMEAGVTAVVQR